ncbi:MAG: T9SS type A sorting domain-containing protein, partial [Bacteroidota bacterium]
LDAVCTDSTLTFTNRTIPGDSSNSISYTWEFGNGSSSTEEAPSFAYPSSDADTTYDVILTAREFIVDESLVCENSTTREVTVYPKPIADFTVDDSVKCFTDPFILTADTSGGPTAIDSLVWTNGIGGIQENGDVFTSFYEDFTQGTSFPVSLTVFDENGCGDIKEQVLEVDISGPSIKDVPYLFGPDILMSRDDSAGAYQWYHSPDTSGQTGFLLVPEEDKGNEQFFCITEAYQGHIFYVGTRLSPDAKCETVSDTINVPPGRFGQPIGRLGLPLGITISPNPNQGKFQMEVLHPVIGTAQIRILNMAGQAIYQRIDTKESSLQRWDLNVPNLAEGMYLLEVQLEGLRFVEKMLVR